MQSAAHTVAERRTEVTAYTQLTKGALTYRPDAMITEYDAVLIVYSL